MKVEVIDVMGNDNRIADAARVSFSKNADNYTEEQNERLIRYLANHNHWTPFSHCIITLREKVPIFVARERFRHTIGFTYNEESRRYIDTPPEFYSPDVWRKRAENKKQGSSEEEIKTIDVVSRYVPDGKDQNGPIFKAITEPKPISKEYEHFLNLAFELYDSMLKGGTAPEQARMVLPQSMYTTYYVTGSLAAFARAYNLRSDPHAQKEIQDLAKMWDEAIKPYFPVAWPVLTEKSE